MLFNVLFYLIEIGWKLNIKTVLSQVAGWPEELIPSQFAGWPEELVLSQVAGWPEELVLSQVAGWPEAEGVTHPQDPTLEADTHWLSTDWTRSHFILYSMRQQTRNMDFEITLLEKIQ